MITQIFIGLLLLWVVITTVMTCKDIVSFILAAALQGSLFFALFRAGFFLPVFDTGQTPSNLWAWVYLLSYVAMVALAIKLSSPKKQKDIATCEAVHIFLLVAGGFVPLLVN